MVLIAAILWVWGDPTGVRPRRLGLPPYQKTALPETGQNTVVVDTTFIAAEPSVPIRSR
jgi:hypothetical protein